MLVHIALRRYQRGVLKGFYDSTPHSQQNVMCKISCEKVHATGPDKYSTVSGRAAVRGGGINCKPVLYVQTQYSSALNVVNGLQISVL